LLRLPRAQAVRKLKQRYRSAHADPHMQSTVINESPERTIASLISIGEGVE
jgi:hypothetical protein